MTRIIANLLEDSGALESPAVQAAKDVVGQLFCANMDTLLSAVRGKVGLFGALPHFVHAFQKCGADYGNGTSGGGGAGIDFTPGPGFTGGQCPVNYQIDWEAPLQDGNVIISNSVFEGPIGSAVHQEGNGDGSVPWGFGRGGFTYGPNATEAWVAFGQSGNWLTGFSITGVNRLDGLPDDCGSLSGANENLPPPMEFPPDAPTDGDGRTIVLPPPGPVSSNLVVNGDFYNISVDIGEITINDEGDLRIPIDGFPIDVTPFLDLVDPSDEVKDFLTDVVTDLISDGNGNGDDVANLEASLQCVISDSCDIQSVQTSIPVWGDIPRQSVIEASGNALVLGVLQNTLEVINESIYAICETLNKALVLEGPTLLLSEVADSTALSGTPTMLPARAEFVDVIFEQDNLEEQRYKRGNDGELQGRFGYLIWGWGPPSDRRWGEPSALWFSRNRVRVPPSAEAPSWVRVSSHPLHAYQIWSVSAQE